MLVLTHFGIDNYAGRHGIVQNLCEYSWFFLCGFLVLKHSDTPNSHNATFVNGLLVGYTLNKKSRDFSVKKKQI